MPVCICDTKGGVGEIKCPAKQVLSRKYQTVCYNQVELFNEYFNHNEFKSNFSLLTHLTKKYGKAYGLTYYTYIFCMSMRTADASFINDL